MKPLPPESAPSLSEVPPAPTAPPADAIDSKPIAGGEITIRLALSPGTITLLASPITVLLTILIGWLLLRVMGLSTYPREMLAGALANALGGLVAATVLMLRMKRGAVAIAQAGLIGIALRMGTVLLGLLVACAPRWGFERFALFAWAVGCYFPLLVVESTLVAWLIRKARR
jgi:hypothetical protein